MLRVPVRRAGCGLSPCGEARGSSIRDSTVGPEMSSCPTYLTVGRGIHHWHREGFITSQTLILPG